MKRFDLKAMALGGLGILCVFTVWYGASRLESMKLLLPDPIKVIEFIFNSFHEPIGKLTILHHIGWSLSRVMTGYLAACVAGVFLGFLSSWFKIGEAILRPFYLVLRSIPSIAWIPLSIIWFGIGEQSKYFIIFMSTMLIVMTNAMDGVKAVDGNLLGAARMLGTREKQLFFHVVLPSAVPQIFSGFQVALGAAWATVIAAEMVRSSEGVGWIILTGQAAMNLVQVFGGIIVIGLIGLFLAIVMRAAEAKLCAWNVRGK